MEIMQVHYRVIKAKNNKSAWDEKKFNGSKTKIESSMRVKNENEY